MDRRQSLSACGAMSAPYIPYGRQDVTDEDSAAVLDEQINLCRLPGAFPMRKRASS